jgi:hypothetical protein
VKKVLLAMIYTLLVISVSVGFLTLLFWFPVQTLIGVLVIIGVILIASIFNGIYQAIK